jgi:hypothetical protein
MKINWIAVLTLIASGGLAVVAQAFAAALPAYAPTIMNIVAIVAATASFLLQIAQPSAKIVQDAPVLSRTSGAQIATNVSTTSTLPISAPQKS